MAFPLNEIILHCMLSQLNGENMYKVTICIRRHQYTYGTCSTPHPLKN